MLAPDSYDSCIAGLEVEPRRPCLGRHNQVLAACALLCLSCVQTRTARLLSGCKIVRRLSGVWSLLQGNGGGDRCISGTAAGATHPAVHLAHKRSDASSETARAESQVEEMQAALDAAHQSQYLLDEVLAHGQWLIERREEGLDDAVRFDAR